MFNYALSPSEVSALYSQETLGTGKFNSKNKGIVYPNPVKDQIFIQLPNYEKSNLTATLSDMSGKIILTEKITSTSKGLFNLNIANKKVSGTYILNVSGENLNSNFKVIAK